MTKTKTAATTKTTKTMKTTTIMTTKTTTTMTTTTTTWNPITSMFPANSLDNGIVRNAVPNALATPPRADGPVQWCNQNAQRMPPLTSTIRVSVCTCCYRPPIPQTWRRRNHDWITRTRPLQVNRIGNDEWPTFGVQSKTSRQVSRSNGQSKF